MNLSIIKTSVACAMAFTFFQTASAADVVCLGSFQDTTYASIAGLARYRILCDDGKNDSVQKAWSYSSAAHESLYQTKGVKLAEKFGVTRVLSRQNNNFGDYDVFLSSGAQAPTRIALLTRSTMKKRGEVTESLTLEENGKKTIFPSTKIASTNDLTNVDKLATQEGMKRSGSLEPSYSGGFEIYVLYR